MKKFTRFNTNIIKISVLLVIAIILIIFINYCFIKLSNSQETILKVNYTAEKDSWHSFSYEISNAKYIEFYATYSNESSTKIENLGNYYLNNSFNVKNIFGCIDKGEIELKIDYEENGFYFYCYSNVKKSKSVTLPSNEIFSYLPYSSLYFTPKCKKINDYTFLIMQGENTTNSNIISVYLTINN